MALGKTYADLDEVKEYLDIDRSDFDSRLDDALITASRAIERYCGRQFNDADTASARVFYPTRQKVAYVDDFHTTTGLLVKTDETDDGTFEETWTSADYQLEPLNGIREGTTGWPYWTIRAVGDSLDFPVNEKGRATLEVTARWGWSTVPAPIKTACLILAAETFKLATVPLGVAGMGEFGFVRLRDNKTAMAKLDPYRRNSTLVSG
jgi:hypothetical protein